MLQGIKNTPMLLADTLKQSVLSEVHASEEVMSILTRPLKDLNF